jgi:hypothetical protein
MSPGELAIELAGWLGAGSLILAYALLSAGRIRNGTAYQLLNLAGALGLAVNAVAHGAFPSAGLNLVWLGIGLVALDRLRRRRVRPAEPASLSSAP